MVETIVIIAMSSFVAAGLVVGGLYQKFINMWRKMDDQESMLNHYHLKVIEMSKIQDDIYKQIVSIKDDGCNRGKRGECAVLQGLKGDV